GGLRLQLELALFAGPSMAPSTTAAAVPTAEPTPAPVAASAPTPEPRSATQPRTARASGTRPAPTAQSPTAEGPEAAPGRAADAEPPEPRTAPTEPAAAPTDPGPTTAAAPTEPAPATAVAPTEPHPATAAALKDSAPAAISPQAAEPQAADTQPAAAEPQPATATNGTELSLERIVAAWPDIVAVLSRQPAIKQLILTCRPVALDGSVVTLGYPEEQAFLREIAERKKAAIEAGIQEVVGHDVGVRCVVANIEVAAASTGGEDGFLMAEARRIFGDDLADVVEID
ncbi:MAG: hypothetical protein QOD78_1060, partial [Chloroflexota bacterium]|nr:hypothetical protein [Chloroflexota bacterium]